QDGIELARAGAAAEEVDEPPETDGRGVVNRGRKPADHAARAAGDANDRVARDVAPGQAPEQENTAAAERRGRGVLHGFAELSSLSLDEHDPLRRVLPRGDGGRTAEVSPRRRSARLDRALRRPEREC